MNRKSQSTPSGRMAAETKADEKAAVRVLVIEDDPKDRTWIMRTLTQAGYAVESVATGAKALVRCQEEQFDAITLDLLLPDMNGREVLKAIRASGLNRETPVVIVTVAADKGIGVGFHLHDILQKPVRKDDLLASLKRAQVAPNGSRPILVVDDNEQELKVAEAILTKLGYRVVCRSDTEGALHAASAETPAAVVLDLLMPVLDGFEFLKRFRSDPLTRRTPVIVWTVKDLTRKEQEALKAAAQAVVQKSEGTAALLEELKACAPPPAAKKEKDVTTR